MKTNNLLSHLMNLEGQLDHYSFEELTSEEASQLKKSFQSFKCRLEEKMIGSKAKGTSLISDSIDFGFPLMQQGMDNGIKEKSNSEGTKLLTILGDAVNTQTHKIIESVDFLKEDKLNSEQRTHIDAIANSSKLLSEVLNGLREYTQLISGRDKLETMDFNFKSVVKDTLYLCNTLIMNDSVRLDVDMDPEIPEILTGDPSKLSQILLTLLGNSVRQATQGSIYLGIKYGKLQENYEVLHFEIRDSVGVGNKESELSLAMVKGTVEFLNGSMLTKTILGVGNVVKCAIPFKRGKEIMVSRYTYDADCISTTDKNIEGLKVLVYEGDTHIQKLLGQRLRNLGCSVYVTNNGPEGMDYLNEHPVDLILIDLHMPVMNGFQVVKKIRESQHDHIKNIPIIVLADDLTVNDKKKCDLLGIMCHIKKSCAPNKLLDIWCKYKQDITSESMPKPVQKTDLFLIKQQKWEVSLTAVLAECKGDISLLEELIGLFKQNMLHFIGVANTYIPQGNFKHLGYAAHDIKTALSMMKAHNLYLLVDEITECCKDSKDLIKMGWLYDQMLLAYPMVEKAIDRELILLKNKKE